MSTEPAYLLGFDEETVYIRRADYPRLSDATEEFRRVSTDEMGLDLSEIEGIEGRAVEAPEHVNDDSDCYHGTCECPPVPLWEFRP